MDETTYIQAAIENLRNQLAVLEEQANDLCQQHLELVKRTNKRLGWNDHSTLFVQARMRDNTLTINWSTVKWYGSRTEGKRRMVKTSIGKRRDRYEYNMVALLDKAQPWEIDMVREIETDLVPVRREAKFIGEAITKLNHITRSSSR